MSSLFNSTAAFQHITPYPDGCSRPVGVAILQDHEFFIRCDPHMVKYEKVTQPQAQPPLIPNERDRTAIGPPTCYQVTDKVHALPAGLWDSDVVSQYEFVDIERGMFVRIRSPLGVMMETLWEIREDSNGSLCLTEDIVVKCPRILMGVIKSTCESGWKGIHEKMINKLKES